MRLISGTYTAPTAYFSVDGGNTKLADFGRTSHLSGAAWNYMSQMRTTHFERPISAAAVDYDEIVGKIDGRKAAQNGLFW